MMPRSALSYDAFRDLQRKFSALMSRLGTSTGKRTRGVELYSDFRAKDDARIFTSFMVILKKVPSFSLYNGVNIFTIHIQN